MLFSPTLPAIRIYCKNLQDSAMLPNAMGRKDGKRQTIEMVEGQEKGRGPKGCEGHRRQLLGKNRENEEEEKSNSGS